MKHTGTIRRRERRAGEMPTARAAIRNFCLQCTGFQAEEVRLCTAPKCWLFPWRFGMTPEKALRRGETIDFLAGNDGKSGGKRPDLTTSETSAPNGGGEGASTAAEEGGVR